MNKLTQKELHARPYGLTVGRLKEFLAKHPELTDDAPVVVERVEDFYFEENGWSVYPKEGEQYHFQLDLNRRMQEEIDRRQRGEKPEYETDCPEDFIKEPSDEDLTQYIPTWCCVKYKDENILFIDLHY